MVYTPLVSTWLQPIAPGLSRWSAPHPAWEAGAEPESVEDWPERVGCAVFEASERVVFIDALVPPAEEALWAELDALVNGRPVSVLTTIRWHGRSRDALVERYGASQKTPPGVEPFEVRGAKETMYWLPGPAALVPGDRLVGTPDGGVRMCPLSWFQNLGLGLDDLRESLRPLLGLAVEHVLVSHGEPVLGGGREALRRALS